MLIASSASGKGAVSKPILYSYLSPEDRVRANHPLQTFQAMADEQLKNMSERFDTMKASTNGRPSCWRNCYEFS
jgi:hypothetical protein